MLFMNNAVPADFIRRIAFFLPWKICHNTLNPLIYPNNQQDCGSHRKINLTCPRSQQNSIFSSFTWPKYSSISILVFTFFNQNISSFWTILPSFLYDPRRPTKTHQLRQRAITFSLHCNHRKSEIRNIEKHLQYVLKQRKNNSEQVFSWLQLSKTFLKFFNGINTKDRIHEINSAKLGNPSGSLKKLLA